MTSSLRVLALAVAAIAILALLAVELVPRRPGRGPNSALVALGAGLLVAEIVVVVAFVLHHPL